MDEQEFSTPNSIPKDLDIICILERDERHHLYKIVRNRTGFSLIAKFATKNVESTPLKNNASVQQTASHQDKKQLSSEDKLRNKWRKRVFFISGFWNNVLESTYGQEFEETSKFSRC